MAGVIIFLFINIQFANMAKRKKRQSNNMGGLPEISPQGYLARIATGDGRKKNPRKNVEDGSLFRW
jgi:hypothetical protein